MLKGNYSKVILSFRQRDVRLQSPGSIVVLPDETESFAVGSIADIEAPPSVQTGQLHLVGLDDWVLRAGW